jgi:hypothetical protein
MADHDLESLASDAFFYGYPLVADLDEVVRFVQHGMGSAPAAPFNVFSHARTLAGPEDTFVTINNDTVYSMAQFDLGVGPLRLDVPDSAGRYYVLQFIDAWTNNFAYVGKRASGTAAGTYLLTPPGWEGRVPDGVREINFPTRVASLLGRWACSGEDDLPAVHVLQDRLALRPLDEAAPEPASVPQPVDGVPDELVFFEKLRVEMAAFPPAPADQDYQQRSGLLGLLDKESPYVNAPQELMAALTGGLATGREKLESFTRSGTVQKVNGWMVGLHMFDYNLDYFGPGTINSSEWKKESRSAAYPERALAARVGLWGNHAYEATYAQVFEDDQNEQLTGSRRYQIHFTELPPVEAFWSLTMYDIPNYYLVANPINRYSIGDRTPGIDYGSDGSLTITIQHDEPTDATVRANWLPSPEGDFRPILRMYEPKAPILSGTYELPPIRRIA